MMNFRLLSLALIYLLAIPMASGQKVGINTDSPVFDLDIRGTDDVNDGGELQLATPAQTNFLRFFSGRLGDHHPFMAFHEEDTFHIVTTLPDWSTYTRHLTMVPSGRIGLNTDIPTGDLDIRPSNVGSGAFCNLGNVDNTHFLRLYSGSNAFPGPAIYWPTGDPLRIGSDAGGFTERMRITSAGLVGIGTNNPLNRLDVRHDGTFDVPTIVLGLISDVSNRPVLQFSEWDSAIPGSGMAIEYNGTSGFDNKIQILGTDQLAKLTVTTQGRIGIATENPNEYLEIGDSGRMFIGNGGGVNRKGLLIDAVEPGNYVRLNAYDYGTATNMDLFIPGNMNIGASTGASGYKLSVDGRIIAEELRIQLSTEWPDYVFDSQYSLSPLGEVENFISHHHHLPSMPSAAQIKDEGLLVGDMQSRLMQKIEELTLYLIQQEKEINALKQEVAHIKMKDSEK